MTKEHRQFEMPEVEPPTKELTEAQFRLELDRAVKHRGDNDAVLGVVNQMLKDIKRYKEMDLRVRYFEKGGQLWLEPEDKGPMGFKT